MLEHKHLIIRAEIKLPITYTSLVEKWAADVIEKLGMKIMMGPFAKYCKTLGNRGITCVSIIETSHVAMHIWDEVKPALVQLDVYSCTEMDPNKIINLIKDELKTVNIEYKFLDRENNFKEITLK